MTTFNPTYSDEIIEQGDSPRFSLVLAAGHGRRMEALSNVLPKPALPLPGGPVISWALRLAQEYTDEVVVNSHQLAEKLEETISGLPDGLAQVSFSREKQLMDTAGGIALARDRGLLGTKGPVLVLNGDCVLRIDLASAIKEHASGTNLVTLVLLPHLDPMLWSRVGLDESGRVATIRPAGHPDQSEVPFLYTGAMIISREALDGLPSVPGGIWDHLWRPSMDHGRLGGVVVTGHWREVGNPRAYLDATMELLRGQPKIDPTASVSGSASIGLAFIGRKTTVKSHAVIAESIISHGATVGRGARIIRSVLLGKTTVKPGETVVNEVRSGRY
jgi:mannose-1-phosphate guanylyltransferase